MSSDRFFDRQGYLEILRKRARGFMEGYRQNIALIGDELVGKTSIIIHFLKNFCDRRMVTVYVDVTHEHAPLFIRRFIGILLYGFLSESGLSLKEDLDFLFEKARRYIPLTVERAQAVLAASQRRKAACVFSDLLQLTELIHQETGKSCFIVFDEFQNLEEAGFRGLYQDWAKALLTQKHTMYVIISSLKFKAKTILEKNLSLLFGNFEIIVVEPFDADTSRRYLAQALPAVKLSSELNNFIIHFTGGCPLYLNIIAHELHKGPGVQHLVPSDGRVRAGARDTFAALLENLLFDAAGSLHQRFSNYIKRFHDLKHNRDYLRILRLIADGRTRVRDIAHALGKSGNEIADLVAYLLETDTITRSGDFLRINDRVFGFWLKFVHQEMLQALAFDTSLKKAQFRQAVNYMICECGEAMQKPMMERLLELFRLFEGEMIQIESKKIRLNRFREIKPLEFASGALTDGIIGRSQEALWIVGLKDGFLTEDDISTFARECRKYRQHKLQQKIIVTLSGIDMNARLRAMEEKVMTWDVNNLNHVFDVFSKPGVMV